MEKLIGMLVVFFAIIYTRISCNNLIVNARDTNFLEMFLMVIVIEIRKVLNTDTTAKSNKDVIF